MTLVCNKGFKMELKTENNQKMLFSWKAKYSCYFTACHGVLKNGSAESRNKSAKSLYANRPDQVSELNTFYRRLVEVLIKVIVLTYRWCVLVCFSFWLVFSYIAFQISCKKWLKVFLCQTPVAGRTIPFSIPLPS